MLVITLRTVTFIAACRWCSRRTISSVLVPWASSRASSQCSAGTRSGSCSRSRRTSWTAKAVGSGRCSRRSKRQRGLRRRALADPEESVRERVRVPAGRTALHDRIREPAQVLDHHDAKRDRHRPQLADRERLHVLVGAHEAAQALGLEVAVGVRDERPGDAEDARISLEGALRQLRQLAVEAGGQVFADLADLIVDDVEVVDEPLGRGRDRPLLADRLRDRPIAGEQRAGVVLQTRRAAGGRRAGLA